MGKNKERMHRSMLLAQIGKGNYRNMNYTVLFDQKGADGLQFNPAAVYQTGYTFEAVLNEIQNNQNNQGVQVDTVILIGTATSFWGSLCSYYMENSVSERASTETSDKNEWENRKQVLQDATGLNEEIELEATKGLLIKRIGEEPVKKCVEDLLTKCLQKKLSCQTCVKIIVMEMGVTGEELKENFSVLQKGLERVVEEYGFPELGCRTKNSKEDERKEEKPEIDIYLDISNGFRSLPMYIYSFASYLTRIRRETYKMYMYYGMAEGSDTYGDRDSKQYAPLVEMNEVIDLMHWINAVNEFHNMGSVRELVYIFEEKEKWNIAVPEENYPNLQFVFRMFDYATNANNLKVLEDTIGIICSFRNIREYLPDSKNLPDSAIVLLENMGKDFEERFSLKEIKGRYKYSYLTLQLANWFYEQGRIGSATIAAMEAITTYLLERFSELDPITIITDYQRREQIKQLLIDENGDMGRAYNRIRKNTRNISAHIMFRDVNEEDLKKYEEDIVWILKEMLGELRIKDDRQSMFFHICGKIRMNTEKEDEETRLKTLMNEWRHMVNEDCLISDPELSCFPEDIAEVLKNLYEQVLWMHELERSGDQKEKYRVFREQISSKKILDQCIQKHGSKAHLDADHVYASIFGRNKKNKWGTLRLLNYYYTQTKALLYILREFTEDSVFINLSNHPSAGWSEEQREAAREYGEILDMAFPNVPPTWTASRVQLKAEEICGEILKHHVGAVMCQGEFTLAYAVIQKLKSENIKVIAACSERCVEEHVKEDGSIVKTAEFCFCGFREYQ